MTFGLSTRLFVEDGPFAQTALLQAGRSTARSWHILDAERRLAVVEQALQLANDRLDGFPLAL
jgi:hypothetical protein